MSLRAQYEAFLRKMRSIAPSAIPPVGDARIEEYFEYIQDQPCGALQCMKYKIRFTERALGLAPSRWQAT